MGPILFGIGVVLTVMFLIALVVEKRSGRMRDSINETWYKVGIICASILGPLLFMLGLFFWGLTFWAWLGILIIVSFIGFLIAFWFVGSFVRVMKGARIINAMIAIELFGLFMMLLAMIVFLAFENSFEVADALLTLGLLCAIPAAIYLIVYFLLILFERSRPVDNRRINIIYDKNLNKYKEEDTGPSIIVNNYYATEQENIQPLQDTPIVEEPTFVPEPEPVVVVVEETPPPQPEPEPQPEPVSVQEDAFLDEEISEAAVAELEEHKKAIEKELEELQAEKKKTEGLIGTHSDEEHAELLAKIAELEEARNRAEEIEKQKRANLLLAQAKRKEKADEKKKILSRENILAKIRKYFTETAACFMMNRDSYKDKFGISPYNRLVVSKKPDGTQSVTHTMVTTGDKFYKFNELLVDVERFMSHPQLMPMFTSLIEEGTSFVRISEKLYILYMQSHKKDFVNDYKYKENFENLLVLVSHSFLLKDANFAHIFTHTTRENMTDHLAMAETRSAFEEAFPQWADLGFENLYDAMVIAYHSTIKDKLSDDEIKALITKDAAKMAKLVDKQAKKNDKATKPKGKPKLPVDLPEAVG
ncbi:MAG: hypothetical protein FWE31_01530 [Firmicutes bacterium]|nr:hypothetical protein [Bacillota bacterium]